MSDSNFYITTTLPYVNAEPHIGFALEIVTADIIARLHRQQGDSVIFNTGTDEHGQKIYDKSTEEQIDPQQYVDKHAALFNQLQEQLDLSFDRFIRTTNTEHCQAAQQFWQICTDNDYIYKDQYQIMYCVGCELEKQASELEDGRCPLHPNQDLVIREEENYFFRFSAFQQPLLELYQSNPDFVKPESKLREIESFVAGGLSDFSISRLKAKMPWGIPVPGDDDHVMYVWFDALVNYISTLGWPKDTTTFAEYWPGTQIAGKDNLRQQAAMWQAMLMAAKLPPSRQILINGFISVAGQKMSKSLGNVISPKQLVERYGTDAARMLLFSLGPVANDMDVTWERFDELYTAVLANGVGNLSSRLATLAAKTELPADIFAQNQTPTELDTTFARLLVDADFQAANQHLLDQIRSIDGYLSETTPWKLAGTEKTIAVSHALGLLLRLFSQLSVIMPATIQQLQQHFGQSPITPLAPLFPRIATPIPHV